MLVLWPVSSLAVLAAIVCRRASCALHEPSPAGLLFPGLFPHITQRFFMLSLKTTSLSEGAPHFTSSPAAKSLYAAMRSGKAQCLKRLYCEAFSTHAAKTAFCFFFSSSSLEALESSKHIFFSLIVMETVSASNLALPLQALITDIKAGGKHWLWWYRSYSRTQPE